MLAMGTALSKDPARTPRAKLSLSSKKKRKIGNVSSTIARQSITWPKRIETGLEEIDQSLLELSLNSGADKRAQRCHWNKLPTELKLHVFSFLGIVMGDPVRHPATTGSRYHLETLRFRLVNKEFRTLYRDVWYKSNTFVVAPIWINPLEEDRPIFVYPAARNGHFIRKLQVELTLDWGHDGLEMLRCQTTDWCRLFRPRPHVSAFQDEHDKRDDKDDLGFDMNGGGYTRHCACGESCSLGTSTTDWQNHFQSLDELKISLRVTGFDGCSEGCTQSAHELIQMFTNSVRRLMIASEIIVSAKNVDVRVHCDCERVAAFVQSLVEGKIKKRCS
ncbi:hypothetical protein DPSP01_011812 [Paraphaeosphaeria sporulosa]|uniref:Uncharacterized protein n=1 Tax=Paraphaeosphaeria sporulosa TaxID=1460663 RepID=A0A177CFD8_9PLEO|nr:uncharacterized protein CC84DRAFT_760532 [Paraphaeosphaeria sporulosa]OAG06314.1 hypothetical protein CC84DRAFT_760532 [Paraphaeosphaeria sporulosa]